MTTDYYLPSRFFESDYHISFEGKTYVRETLYHLDNKIL
nr:phosphatidylinositol-specific phospholipase C1-like protein [Algibacter lectus]